MIDFFMSNSLGSALAATAIVTLIMWLWKCNKSREDSKKIYNFLLSSKISTNFTFRSTEAISAHTKISESRVAEICSKHPKIKRNEKTKQSWQIVE